MLLSNGVHQAGIATRLYLDTHALAADLNRLAYLFNALPFSRILDCSTTGNAALGDVRVGFWILPQIPSSDHLDQGRTIDLAAQVPYRRF